MYPVPLRTRYAAALCRAGRAGLAGLAGLAVLAGCGGHANPRTSQGLVPWTDDQADTAQLSQAATQPTCRVTDLRLPAREQHWGGVWNGEVTGYLMIANAGSRTCELPRPATVRAVVGAGALVGFGIADAAAPAVTLAPGDRVQVQVSAPYDCGKSLVRSTAFTFAFPTGILRVPGAQMAVQCGGALSDFSGRDASATSDASTASRLRVSISRVPARVIPGGVVTYAVMLTNPTSSAISLSPCPSYQEGIKGEPASVRTYRLNCGAVRQVAPHARVGFEMRLALPDALESGDAVLDWRLQLPAGAVDSAQFASASTSVR